MSYILDALKKSEKERRRTREKDNRSVHESVTSERKNRPLWPYFLGVLLLLNASVLLFWLRPWQALESHSVRVTDSRLVNRAGMGDVPSGLSEKITEDKKIESGELAKPVPDIIPSKEKRINLTTGVKEGASPEDDQVSASHDALTEPTHESEIALPDKDRLYTLNDLPPPLKQSLPEFSVSVFFYSDDPASRMVRINGQSLKEGQFLTEDVRLEEIVPDGVIFSCRAYRFHVRLK